MRLELIAYASIEFWIYLRHCTFSSCLLPNSSIIPNISTWWRNVKIMSRVSSWTAYLCADKGGSYHATIYNFPNLYNFLYIFLYVLNSHLDDQFSNYFLLYFYERGKFINKKLNALFIIKRLNILREKKCNYQIYNVTTKKRTTSFAWAPAVLSTALAHESTNSSTGTRKFNNIKQGARFARQQKGNFTTYFLCYFNKVHSTFPMMTMIIHVKKCGSLW